MPLAIEYLTTPRVLLVKVYAPCSPIELRGVVENIENHGCYTRGVPILIDASEAEGPKLSADLRTLVTALGTTLPRSPVVGVVPTPDLATAGGTNPLFTTRADALRWLQERRR